MATANLSIATHVGMQKSVSPRLFLKLPSPTLSFSFISIPIKSYFPPLSTLNQKRVRKISAQVQQVSQSDSKQRDEFNRKLFVGNIPRTCTNEELAEMFGEFGTVEKAEVICDKYTRKSRRFAFVTMNTVEEAQAAVAKMDGTEIGGREIKVNVTEKPLDTSALNRVREQDTFVDSSFKVYVGNLAKTVTTESLKEKFKEKGNVLDAKVVRIPKTGKSCGYGFVSFSSEDDMQAAIASFNNKEFEGKPIRVNVV